MASESVQRPLNRAEVLDWQQRVAGSTPERVLGVAPGADAAEVRAAFSALVRRYHPDVVHDAGDELRAAAQEAFIRVNQAYRALTRDPPARTAAAMSPRLTAPTRVDAPPSPAVARTRTSTSATGVEPPPAAAGSAFGELAGERVAAAIEAAGLLLRRNAAEEAVRVLHPVVASSQGAARRRVRLLLARAYLSERRWQRCALALLAELLQEDSRDGEALTVLGRLYWREGLALRAEATLRRALAGGQEPVEARRLLDEVEDELRRRHAPADPSPRRARPFGRFIPNRCGR